MKMNHESLFISRSLEVAHQSRVSVKPFQCNDCRPLILTSNSPVGAMHRNLYAGDFCECGKRYVRV